MLVMCLALFHGCAPQPRGEAVVRHERGRTPVVTRAPYDGEYLLYGKGDDKPRAGFRLNRGDRLGFASAAPGRIAAVAGKQQGEADEQDMVWRRK